MRLWGGIFQKLITIIKKIYVKDIRLAGMELEVVQFEYSIVFMSIVL